MLTGKVVGNIVSTQKHAKLVGYKLLVVEIAAEAGTAARKMVVVDTLGAGRGETVLICTGSAARVSLGDDQTPVDAVVVGIVDRMESGKVAKDGT